ncbi:MAG TPA: hypothetical protein VMK16_09610 [Acidimicrobiales bacterium]|nr:hypothetical protein [Acidimicrobiales bacterium]
MPVPPPSLSAEQLVELLALLKKVDSVELKLTVPADSGRRIMENLGLDPLEAQIRQVVFFDTPDLTLDKAGVVARARRLQVGIDDSTVKLRPVEPDNLPSELRKNPTFGVEVDAIPGGFVCSGSMKNEGALDVRAVLHGEKTIKKLFSKEQREFYAAHAPEGLDLNQLSILGPINVFKLKWKPEDFPRKVVAELWNYPDGSRILELSTKCLPGDAFQAAAESRAFLSSKGVETGGTQSTKTRTALEFFANELKSQVRSA